MTTRHLHRFTFPTPDGWRPATLEDGLALGNDLIFYGISYATDDGRRVDPATVKIVDGEAYGGEIRLPQTRRRRRWWRR